MKKTLEFTKENTLGDVVARFPKAAEVFKSYKIDFCCGGQRTLEEAAKEKNVEVDTVLASIHGSLRESELEEGTLLTDLTNEQLIDHIVNTHHAYLNENLPVISKLANAVLRAHGDAHPELFEVFKDFHALKAELEQHLIKEEVVLFPSILKGKDHQSVQQEVENEHEGAGELLRDLRDLTQDFTVPADGCPSYVKFYGLLEELESDIFQHVHKENNILFLRG